MCRSVKHSRAESCELKKRNWRLRSCKCVNSLWRYSGRSGRAFSSESSSSGLQLKVLFGDLPGSLVEVGLRQIHRELALVTLPGHV